MEMCLVERGIEQLRQCKTELLVNLPNRQYANKYITDIYLYLLTTWQDLTLLNIIIITTNCYYYYGRARQQQIVRTIWYQQCEPLLLTKG